MTEGATNLVGSGLVLGGKLDLTRRPLGEYEDAVLLARGDSTVEVGCVRSIVLEVELVLLADVLYRAHEEL